MGAVVGSAGDDTITAPATVAATGAAQTTINSGDSIDGGTGTDTLTLTLAAANNNSLSGLTIKGVENITYVGLDNAGANAAAIATATTAAAAKAGELTAAVAANASAITAATASQVAYDAARTVQDAVMTTVTKFTNLAAGKGPAGAALSAETPAGIAADYGLTLVGTTNTLAGLKAAASAALKATDGTATTDATIEARADALSAVALLVDTGTDAAATTALAAVAPAYSADALAKANLAGAVASLGAVTLAANADATSITIDGTTTTVSGLTDAQTVTMAGTIANTASAAATATTANVKLSSAAGTLTVTGSTPLVTASVSGSLKAGAAATTSKGATPGSITLVDGATTDTIKTLKLGITNNGTVGIAGMTALTAIDGAASTGGLTLTPVDAILNVTTGAGDDTVTFIAATDNTNAKKLTSSLDTGAGKDKITVNVTGTGTSTVNAGAGDDSVTMTSAVGTAVVDGGEGKDTVTIATTTFGTGTYNGLKSGLLNFEVLALSGAAVVDAAKASQFTEFTFTGGGASAITKVADTQTVNVTAAAAASSAGYVAKGAADANGYTALATAYAGTLNATVKGTTTLTANASALTLAVSNVSATTDGVTTVEAATAATLTGDVKTAVITVGSSVNNSKLPTSEFISSVSMTPTGTLDAGGAFTTLGNLTSVTLSGTGSATVNNATAAVTTGGVARSSKLATIDASGLVGKKTIAGATLGDATAGLTFTAGLLAEAVKLGTAIDKLNFDDAASLTSTYAKMDSITGFSVVLNASGVMDAITAPKSDDITIGGAVATFIKAAAGFSTTSLDAALNTLANRTTAGTDKVVFQTAGNTYIFVDAADAATGVADNDTVIELVGLVDLDALIYVLATNV